MFTTCNVASSFGATKAQFLVDASHLPAHTPPFVNNPVYAQPLYVTNVTLSTGTYNILYIAALDGEVYAYDADNTSSPTKLWYRDETNTATGMQGLKHDCDVSGHPGATVVSPIGLLQFAGVISTPVIEFNSASGSVVLYVASLCERTSDNSSHWWLNALNIFTGANFASPVEIEYSAADVSANPYGPHQQFSASNQLERASLLRVNGAIGTTGYKSVLAGFGTSVAEDGANAKNYQGWMFAYDANPATQLI